MLSHFASPYPGQQHQHQHLHQHHQQSHQQYAAAALASSLYESTVSSGPHRGLAPAVRTVANSAELPAGTHAALAHPHPHLHYPHHQLNTSPHHQAPPLPSLSVPALQHFAQPQLLHSQRPVSHVNDSMADDHHQYSEQDLANLQKLSAQFEPKATGPMVSKKLPTTSITAEYASADPIYQTKTAALPQRFHKYRTVRGDGHCGWRAVAFTYFETLQRLGDAGKFDEEMARLSSMRNLLQTSGYTIQIFEDWEEETLECLRRTRDSLSTNDTDALLQTFNSDVSMYIITHFKILASAYMKTHVNDFEPFIEGMSVDEYCAHNIEPANCELDNLGLLALYSILVKPAGITLEVMYLDRSAGTETNSHRYEADGDNASTPVIHLLYRPGHYDILYRIPPPPAQNDYVVNYLRDHDQFIPAPRVNNDVLTLLPGMPHTTSSYMPDGCWGSNTEFTPSPVSAIPNGYMQPMQSYNAPPPTPATPSVPQVQDYAAPPVSAIGLQPQMEMPMRPMMNNGSRFRPSLYSFDQAMLAGGIASQPSTCQTSIFRNSHFNTAHYLNPEFEPEQWDPSHEYATSSRTKRGP